MDMELDTIASALTDHISEREPVTTAPEIAETTGIDRRRVNEGLRLLRRNGEAASKDVGARARVWWPQPHPWRQNHATEATDDAIKQTIADWNPGRNVEEQNQRRQNGRQILQWLRNRDHGARKRDFTDHLYPEYCDGGASQDAWWRRQVRPLLETAADHGHVEQHDRLWIWTDDS